MVFLIFNNNTTWHYLAEIAMIGLNDCCRPTATTPVDILEHARITVENILIKILILKI